MNIWNLEPCFNARCLTSELDLLTAAAEGPEQERANMVKQNNQRSKDLKLFVSVLVSSWFSLDK